MTALTCIVRPLSEHDLPTLLRDFPQPRPEAHAVRLNHQSEGDYSYLCAEVDETVAAIQLIRWTGPRRVEDRRLSQLPEIGSLYVLPEYRGNHIGTQLVQYSEDLIYSRHYSGVGAIIKDSNTVSIAMHLDRGYKPVGIASRTEQDPGEPRTYYIKRFVQKDL